MATEDLLASGEGQERLPEVDLVRMSLHILMQFSSLSSGLTARTTLSIVALCRDAAAADGHPASMFMLSSRSSPPGLRRLNGLGGEQPAIVTVAASGVVTVTRGVDGPAEWFKDPKEWKEFICCVRPSSPPSATVTMTQITSDQASDSVETDRETVSRLPPKAMPAGVVMRH